LPQKRKFLKGLRLGRLFNQTAVAATVLDDSVFILTSSLSLLRFSLSRLETTKIACNVINHAAVTMVTYSKKMYVAGRGLDQRKQSKENLELEVIATEVTPDIFEVFDRKFVLAGANEDDSYTSVYTINPDSKEKIWIGNIPCLSSEFVSFKSFDRFYFLYCDGSLLALDSGAGSSIRSLGRLWDGNVSLSAALLVDQKLVLFVKDSLLDDFRDKCVTQEDFNFITFMKADGSFFMNTAILSTTFDVMPDVHLNFFERLSEFEDDNDEDFDIFA